MASQNKKKKKRKWIVPVAIVAAGAVVAIWVLPNFFLGGNAQAAAAPVATATAETGTIETTVVGSGTLSMDGLIDISIPSAVTADEVLVEAGDTVQEGDTLAVLNAASVTSAITSVQAELTSIDESIESALDEDEDLEIASSVSGRVKEILATEGDDVLAVVEQSGALMVLSIDGYMNVEFEPAAGVAVGQAVIVTLADGSTEDGKVVLVEGNKCKVILTDNGPGLGEQVSVSDEDGGSLGSGQLAINAPLGISAGAGVIESVDVELNESVSSGDALFTLQEDTTQESYQSLLEQRAEQEELLQTLLALSKTNTLTASSGGTVSEVNISANGSTASNGTADSAASPDSSGQIPTAVAEGGVSFTYLSSVASTEKSSAPAGIQTLLAYSDDSNMAATTELTGELGLPVQAPVTGGIPQTTIAPATEYTGTITWQPQADKFAGQTVYTAEVTMRANAGYRFADAMTVAIVNADGTKVDGVTIEGLAVTTETEQNTVTFKAVFAATAQEQTNPNDQNTQGGGTGQANPSVGSSAISGMSGGSSSAASGMSSGSTVATSADASSSDTSAEEASLTKTAFSIYTGGATTLQVSIDELDILTIEEGQEASVVLDALPDETFTATVTKISASGTAQTGVTTYPVTMQLMDVEGTGAMEGMNATATIVTAVSEGVLLIPMDALIEMGGQKFVMIAGTETSQEGEELAGEMREVETGLSDGLNVEIVSGLAEGEQVMWQDTTSDDASQDMMFSMGGGMMQGGSGEGPPGDFGGEMPPGDFSGGPPNMGG